MSISTTANRFGSKIGLADWLFFLWILLVPFSSTTSYYVGIGLDKAMAPLILLIGFFQTRKLASNHLSRVIFYCIIATLFILMKNISTIFTLELFLAGTLRTAINVGYFVIPILFIRNLAYLRTVHSLLIIVAICSCLSAFLVSVGVITLPYERFEASRLEFEYLPKSVGILSNYGEMAQISAYTLLLLCLIPRKSFFFGYPSRFVKILFLLVLLLGLIGGQSRNVLLTVLLSGIIAWLFLAYTRRGERQQIVTTLLLAAGLLSAGAILILARGALVTTVSGLGGESALQTAEGRFEQYRFALDIIAQFPILGADGPTYAQLGLYINGIHNMWLQLAAQGGIVTAGIMFFWIGYSFLRSLRLANKPVRPPEAVVVVSYFPALVFSTMFYVGGGILFFMLLGIAVSFICIGTPRAKSRHPKHALGRQRPTA